MKNRFFFLFLCVLFVACQSPNKPQEDRTTRPNIILIIADDMAWDDAGVYGHPHIKTPHIDQLARDGMLFHNAFLTASSCSPSRASIITGTYPHQTDAEQLHWPIPANRLTFVERLRSAGYWTAQAGKWHFGDAIKDRFDLIAPENTAGFVFQANQENSQKATTENDGSGCQKWTSVLNQRVPDKPFFLWLAAVDPHRPYDQPDHPTHTPEMVRIPPYLPDNEQVRNDFVNYYEEIHRMDRYIGELVADLDAQELSENTLILFISDNGRPFPREKTTLYDGGIKTPWIVKWPNQIQKGSETEMLVSSIDIATTCLSLAGAQVDAVFEGKDFSPLFQQGNEQIREYIYAEDHWHDFEDYARAIRSTEYKYIRNFYPDLPNTPPADALRSPTFQSMLALKESNSLSEVQMACFVEPRAEEELYHIPSDPHELTNLAGDPAHQDLLDQLRLQMKEIRSQTDDVLPTARTADEFTRDSGKPLPNRERPRASKADMFPESIKQ